MLNIIVTHSWLNAELSAVMQREDLTPSQYNVLRILKGSHPARVPCSYIRDRLLDRTPDVTRLLDRLERSGLIVRERAEHDRRVVEVGLAEEGLARLDRLYEPVEQTVEALLGKLTEKEQQQLSVLLEKMRATHPR